MKRQSLDIDSVLAEKIECLQIYASQFEIDKIRPVIEGYARLASSAKGGYAETLWQLTRPPSFPFAPLVVVRGCLMHWSKRQRGGFLSGGGVYTASGC